MSKHCYDCGSTLVFLGRSSYRTSNFLYGCEKCDRVWSVEISMTGSELGGVKREGKLCVFRENKKNEEKFKKQKEKIKKFSKDGLCPSLGCHFR